MIQTFVLVLIFMYLFKPAYARFESDPGDSLTILETLISGIESAGDQAAAIEKFSGALALAKRFDLEDLTPEQRGNLDSSFQDLIRLSERLAYYQGTGEVYLAFGKSYLSANNLSEAIRYFEKAVSVFKHHNRQHIKHFEAIEHAGISYYYSDDYETSYKIYLYGLQICKEVKNLRYQALYYYSAGFACLALCRYDQALEMALKSLTTIDSLEAENSETEILINYKALAHQVISGVYYDLKNFKKSITYAHAAYEGLKKSQSSNLILSLFNDIGRIYSGMGKPDSALIYFNRGLEVSKRLDDEYFESNFLHNIGKIYADRDAGEKAFRYYERSYLLARKVDDQWGQAQVCNYLGRAHTINGSFSEAEKFYRRGYTKAAEIKAKDLILQNYKYKADHLARRGSFEGAYKFQKKYALLNDSLQTKGSHDIAEMQMRYERDKRTRETEILRRNNAIQKLELEKHRLYQWLMYSIIITAAIVVFFILAGYRSKHRANLKLTSRVEEALVQQNQQHQIIVHQAGLSSLGKMMAAMAHEINQPLQDLILSTELIEMEYRDKYMKNMVIGDSIREIHEDIDRIKNTIDHIRFFAGKQNEQYEDDFQINHCVRMAYRLVRKQLMRINIEVNLELKENLPEIRGNPYKIEQVVLNIISNAQDALVEKAELLDKNFPKKLTIRTCNEGDNVVLRIRDNGIGFEPGQQAEFFKPFYTTKQLGQGTGLGLSIASGMIHDMNGSISIKGAPMEGAEVCVELPCVTGAGINERT